MEFLEFLNLDNTTHKKCSKVRSWYLYEQFKSLERNQLDAAKKLKEKSLQEKILLQELYERRERRRFCEGGAGECIKSDLPGDNPMDLHILDSKDQLLSIDGSESPSSIKSKSAHSFHNVVQAAGRRFEEDNGTTPEVTTEKETTESSCDECLAQIQDHTVKEEESPSEADYQNLAVIDELINNQLETVKEEIGQLQNYTTIYEDVKSPDFRSNDAYDSCDYDSCKETAVRNDPDPCAAIFVWTKLVSFAYQIIQLSHGNCYYDYSTQILTAILACDILRRGLCKMSDYLQPFICPVKLSEEPCYEIKKQRKLKTNICRNKEKNNCELKMSSSRSDQRFKKRFTKRKACSEYLYRDVVKPGYNWTDDTKVRSHSEPWHKPSRHSWRRDFRPYRAHYNSLCRCCKHTINPMMKLSHFIDKVVSEIMSSSSRENL